MYSYHYLAPLKLLNGDGNAIDIQFYVSNQRHIADAYVAAALHHREGHQVLQAAAGPRQDVPVCALEVVAKAIEGLVVHVPPGPAGGVKEGRARGATPFHTAGLLISAVGVLTRIWEQERSRIHDPVLLLKILCNMISCYIIYYFSIMCKI
uniref:Uncharacterized protein n=1 Tax=Electrophorus electricus TaxID=8005 RepID=A0A4W4GHV5_ELEEL